MDMHSRTALRRGIATLTLAICVCAVAHAQTISTIAGTGVEGPIGDGGPATAASLFAPTDVVVDAAGNRYVSDFFHYRIRRITPAGVISTIAGNGTGGSSGDGGPATSASIGGAYQILVDGSGNLYFTEYAFNRVRKVSAAGIISTIAGTGVSSSTGDGGPASAATLKGPVGIALDAAGNLYVGEYNGQRIRRITPAGIISTFAGTGAAGFSGDGGPATAATFFEPFGLNFDNTGNLLVADAGNVRVRRITPAGIISTIAGNGSSGFSGDGGAATSAAIDMVIDVSADATNNLYLGVYEEKRVRKVTAAGIISTFAGNGSNADTGDGGPATSAGVRGPYGVAAAAGQLYIATVDGSHIRMVNLFTSCAVEGYTGSKLTLCRQVCESHYPATTLNALLRGWLTLYHENPPCAR